MTDIESRAHHLAVEFAKIKLQEIPSSQQSALMFANLYKQALNTILNELRR